MCRCWDCAFLGRCQRASGRIKSCKIFKAYEYRDKAIAFDEVAKILGISERTLFRRMKKSESAVLAELKAKGKIYRIEKEDRQRRMFFEVYE